MDWSGLYDFTEWYLYEACQAAPKASDIAYQIGPARAWAYRGEVGGRWHVFVYNADENRDGCQRAEREEVAATAASHSPK